MKYYFPYLIFSIFIISNKFFLFNEEFLILLCFTSFCFVLYLKLSSLIQQRFDEKINLDKFLILESLLKIEKNLNQKYILNNKITKIKNLFIMLKNYYTIFSNKFVRNFFFYLNNNQKIFVVNKLSFLKLIESEYSKFVLILITKKINSLSKLIFFMNNNLLIKKFNIINKINKLLLLKKI